MDYKVEIIIKDVELGDLKDFLDDIELNWAPNFDAPKGDFAIRVAELSNGNWFPIDDLVWVNNEN